MRDVGFFFRYMNWNEKEKVIMLDSLINVSQASEVRHMLKVIEPHFQRDFISNLPREVDFLFNFIFTNKKVIF